MRHLTIAFVLLSIAAGCSRYGTYVSHYSFSNKVSIPDYSQLDYWASHPWKKDPADSVPAGIKDRTQDSLVDVFFIHPTTYTRNKKEWNADINDAYLNAKTDYSTILYQASVFNQHARLFAPRYRQAHLSAFFTNSREASDAFDTAYADLKQAFEYYLAHYNNNRPIIIAGHSQGALMAKRLLKEFFDGKPLQQKLVAAYVIGWPVQQNYFTSIPVCESASQTGCFCSWRTFRTDFLPGYVKNEKRPAAVTNPLSWTTKETYADRSENLGSVLRNLNKVFPATTDAQIHSGVLWVSKPRFPGSVFFFTRNYHIADINLFYMNIRQNVEERIQAYSKQPFIEGLPRRSFPGQSPLQSHSALHR